MESMKKIWSWTHRGMGPGKVHSLADGVKSFCTKRATLLNQDLNNHEKHIFLQSSSDPM